MKAMYVNQLSHAGTRYADLIASGHKTIETRSKNMLSALIGERVAIVRTVRGKKPLVIGYVDITRSSFCSAADFEEYYSEHFVGPGSAYDVRGKGKWFYHLAHAETCTPYELPADVVRHGRSWCEW